MTNRLLLAAAFIFLGLMSSAAHSGENTLPPPLGLQLSALILSSMGKNADSEICVLASQNPGYSDEIACLAIQFFGQADTIEQNVLQGISDPGQQTALSSAVMACSLKDVAGGYGVAIASFNQGVIGGDMNTLSNTQDNT